VDVKVLGIDTSSLFEVRKVDSLGRVVLPSVFRKCLEYDEYQEIEFLVNEDKIILKKHILKCIFCINDVNLINYKGKMICSSCLEKLKSINIDY
jgi:AbrB family transcriptional regulator, transcriptional pleiotropic regulator of transition state genes